MAYVSFDEGEEEVNSSGPLVPGGAPTQNAPVASSTAAAEKPKTPGNFANLNEYLRVNAPQQFGSELAGKVGADVNQAQDTLASSGQEFKSRVDASRVADDQGLTQKVASAPEEVDVGAFAKLRDAQYQGPTSFGSAQDLYNRTTGTAAAAQGKAQAAKSEGGRFALLDSYFGKPQYSQGQKTLDNLLVQNDPNAQQAFKQIQANANELQANVRNANQDLSAYGNKAQIDTQNARRSAREAVGIDDAGNRTGTGALGALETSVADRLKARQEEADLIASLISDPNKISKVSPEMEKLLGPHSYGVDARNYASSINKGSLSAPGVASAEQLAKLRALSQLAGVEDTYNVEGAGKYADSPLYNFDESGYTGEVAMRKGAYEKAVAPIANEMRQLQWQIDNVKRQYPDQANNNPTIAHYSKLLNEKQRELDRIRNTYGFAAGGSIPVGGVTGGIK